MRVAVVTVFPEMLGAVADYGVTGRAVRDGRLQLSTVTPREFATDRHRSVDDRPYGGGPGMVMSPGPLRLALERARGLAGEGSRVVYLSPQGRRFNDSVAREMAERDGLVLLAGRYEGVDERLIESSVDDELSIGDFVLSGGELAAMVVIDAVARLLPGVLGHEDSAGEDSFAAGLLDCPHYTRPEEFEGRAVPAVLLSGDHAAIRRWRLTQALGRTAERRPDLLAALNGGAGPDDEQRQLLEAYRRERGALEDPGASPMQGDVHSREDG